MQLIMLLLWSQSRLRTGRTEDDDRLENEYRDSGSSKLHVLAACCESSPVAVSRLFKSTEA